MVDSTLRNLGMGAMLVLGAWACAPIQHTTASAQPLETPLLAGIGDVVLRIDKKRNLQNAFGASDIFGRKTNEGFVEIRYAGVERSGEVVLARKDVQIVSNETTMSRTPLSYTAGQATTNATGTVYSSANSATLSGTAKTTYQSATIAPLSDFHVVVPSDSMAIRLVPPDNLLPVEGHVIEILRATSTSLQYRIRKQ